MALAPVQWLDRLTAAMDSRAGRFATLRSYMDGAAPLPEGAAAYRDAYRLFQKKSRTNFGELVASAPAERMINSGFRIGNAEKDDDQARAIWSRNRLQVGASDVHLDMLCLGVGYVMVQPGLDGAVVTVERPEQVIVEYDAFRPDLVRAGIKVWSDPIEGYDYAMVHIPGEVHTFVRPLEDEYGVRIPRNMIQGDWVEFGSDATGLDVVPIVPFVNRRGLGEFETHLDLLDRINWVILQRLVITAMQAYRQRGLSSTEELPTEDEEGNQIDYRDVFRPGPGELWSLPVGASIWESATTDFTPILSAVKDDLAHLAAVTRTPMSTLVPDGANQSAEGAAFAREGLVFKTLDRVERAGDAWALVMGLALALEQGVSAPVSDVHTEWLPVERQSLAERADAASKAQDIPWRYRMLKVYQFSAEEVDRMEAEHLAEVEAAKPPPPAPVVVAPAAPVEPDGEPV